ncbi:hypothetical protein [Bradyrhizobium sp. LTSP885]|uniref:hypothetical protein n=1 Tax=Bradyrhizobium sp. LTSP885 TaxID=1619232 RepID=UPI000B04EED5|nr:hypothetical protein [Bradyrhizobium sp. LTSP885]
MHPQKQWPKWLAAVAVVYVALATWLHRSYVSPLPPGRFARVLARPFVVNGQAAEARSTLGDFNFLERISTDADGPDVKGAQRSRLQLYEDGKLLGPGHCSFADIRDNGHGRFLHYPGLVIFSSSDGSNPNSNGRAYFVVIPD